nr:hypothetical protein [uncultured Prevotella sp.]
MLKLHIFNPEHDLALACNQWQYTPPSAARRLGRDLGWLPVIWADTGDFVLVDDVREAADSVSLLQEKLSCRLPSVHFITCQSQEFKKLTCFDREFAETNGFVQLSHPVDPWGWDKSVIRQLFRSSITEACVSPGSGTGEGGQFLFNEQWIRDLSSRQHWRTLLQQNVVEVGSKQDLATRIGDLGGKAVLKTPWSNAGRGVRFVDYSHSTALPTISFPCLVEPFYQKVMDFALEFEMKDDGTVHYLGLNLFQTKGASYVGNILATEEEKERILCEWVSVESLRLCREHVGSIASEQLDGHYVGPFGIDLMVVKLHPSVGGSSEYGIRVCELNLRRTMGHVALALSQFVHGLMSVTFDGDHYHLEVKAQ